MLNMIFKEKMIILHYFTKNKWKCEMILPGKEIFNNTDNDIIIQPFSMEKLNYNSYNLTLLNELLVYKNETLAMNP